MNLDDPDSTDHETVAEDDDDEDGVWESNWDAEPESSLSTDKMTEIDEDTPNTARSQEVQELTEQSKRKKQKKERHHTTRAPVSAAAADPLSKSSNESQKKKKQRA